MHDKTMRAELLLTIIDEQLSLAQQKLALNYPTLKLPHACRPVTQRHNMAPTNLISPPALFYLLLISFKCEPLKKLFGSELATLISVDMR